MRVGGVWRRQANAERPSTWLDLPDHAVALRLVADEAAGRRCRRRAVKAEGSALLQHSKGSRTEDSRGGAHGARGAKDRHGR